MSGSAGDIWEQGQGQVGTGTQKGQLEKGTDQGTTGDEDASVDREMLGDRWGQVGTGTCQGTARNKDGVRTHLGTSGDKDGIRAHLGTVGSWTCGDRDSKELDIWGQGERGAGHLGTHRGELDI